MLPRGALAPGGPTTRGLELGAELLLALCVRAEGQPPALPAPGFGPLRAPRTGLTGTGRQLGVLAWAQRPGLGVGTGDRAVLAGQRAGVLGHQRPAWRPGAGQAGPPWRAPWGPPWACPSPQGDVQLDQARAWRQRLRQPLYGRMRRGVGRTAHPLARAFAGQGQGLLAAGASWGAALAAVAHVGVLHGAPSVGGHGLLEAPRARSPLRGWLGSLRANLADGLQDLRPGRRRRREAWRLLEPAFPPRHLLQAQAQRACPCGGGPPLERQRGCETARPHQRQSRVCPEPRGGRAQGRGRAAHGLPPRLAEQVERVRPTRPAPHRGGESRAARRGLAPPPPVCAAQATGRSSHVWARWGARSRRRQWHSVPRLQGGGAAPRPSTPICQRLAITVRSTASCSRTWP